MRSVAGRTCRSWSDRRNRGETRGSQRLLRAFVLSLATMPNLTIRKCRLEEVYAVLELWQQAEATPGVTDTADDLRRAIADSPAHVLVAEADEQIVGSIIGTFDGWRGQEALRSIRRTSADVMAA
jgi:hypothetical protein